MVEQRENNDGQWARWDLGPDATVPEPLEAGELAAQKITRSASRDRTFTFVVLVIALLLLAISAVLARWIHAETVVTKPFDSEVTFQNAHPVTSAFGWTLGSNHPEYVPDANYSDPEFFPVYSEREGPNMPDGATSVSFYTAMRVANWEPTSGGSVQTNQPIHYKISVEEIHDFGEVAERAEPLSAGSIPYIDGDELLSSDSTRTVAAGALGEKNHELVITFNEARQPLVARYFCYTVDVLFPYVDQKKFYLYTFDGELIKFGRYPDVAYGADQAQVLGHNAFGESIITMRATSQPSYGIFRTPEFKVKYEWRAGLKLNTANPLVRQVPLPEGSGWVITDFYNPKAYASGNDSGSFAENPVSARGNEDSLANSTTVTGNETLDYAPGKNFWYEQIVPSADITHNFYAPTPPLAAQTAATPPLKSTVYIRMLNSQGIEEYRRYRVFPLLSPGLSQKSRDLLRNIHVDWTDD